MEEKCHFAALVPRRIWLRILEPFSSLPIFAYFCVIVWSHQPPCPMSRWAQTNTNQQSGHTKNNEKNGPKRWPEVNIMKMRFPVARSTSRPITGEVSQFLHMKCVKACSVVVQPFSTTNKDSKWSTKFLKHGIYESVWPGFCHVLTWQKWQTMIHIWMWRPLSWKSVSVLLQRGWVNTQQRRWRKEPWAGSEGFWPEFRKMWLLKRLKGLTHFSYN